MILIKVLCKSESQVSLADMVSQFTSGINTSGCKSHFHQVHDFTDHFYDLKRLYISALEALGLAPQSFKS